jgi:hypothetical protein
MSGVAVLLIPFVRLAGHSLASAFGFLGIVLTTVLPVHSVHALATFGLLDSVHITVLDIVEAGLMGLDILLLCFVVLLYSGVFAIEQWRAAKHILS